jgi:DNA-directed RNA polymerase subunit A"
MATKSVSTSKKEKIVKKTDNTKLKSSISVKKTQEKIIVKTPPKKTTKKNDKNQLSITQFIKKCVNSINSNDIIFPVKNSNNSIEPFEPNTQEKQIKRKLTIEEKENICDFLTVNPGCDFEHAICILENTKIDILNQLDNIEIYPSLIPSLKNEIINYYNHSQIQPGQMVGVDSATSLGEPTTQMSVVKNEVVNIVRVEKKTNDISFISSTIGKFCDDIIRQYPEYTFNTHSNDNTVETIKSVETELKHLNCDYYVVSVNKNEKTEWNKISHISRHPVNGQIVKVKTKSGRTIETTLSHSHLTRKNNSVVPIKGSELKIGMRIPVCKFISDKFTISKNRSTFVGSQDDEHSIFYLAEDIAYSRINKIPNSVFLLPNKLKKIFIKTMFDILSIQTIDNEHENYEIELVSSKEIVLKLSLLLNYFGIFSKINSVQMKNDIDDRYKLTIPNQYIPVFNLIITQNHKMNNDYILYNKIDDEIDCIEGVNEIIIKCASTLNVDIPVFAKGSAISRKNITNFLRNINDFDISDIENEVKLLKQAIYSDIVWDEIVELDIYTPSQDDFVYDFTVPGCETFLLNCGILTHNTLNSFHSAGKTCAAVTTGVPRFRELIDASKQQKHTLITFSLNDKENLKVKEIQDAKRLCRQFDEKRILSLLEITIPEISNFKYNNLDKDKDWYLFFESFIHSDFKKFNWSLRFKFNKDSLFEYRMTLKHISHFIEKELGNCVCVYSPDNIGIIDVYIDVSNVKKDELVSYRKQIDTIKKIDKKKTLIDENNKYYYYIRDIIFQYICNIKVSGIDCIEKGYFRQEKINGINKWIFDLEGTNYREILNHPLINYKDCMVNNMWELFNALGIEAVRRFLVNEFSEVITSGGINVDKTHLELLADSMTCTGNITSVSRYGIGRNETGPLTKASFEQSLDNMLIAAYRSETESIKSVSSSIIMGQCSRIGSGIMELYTNINPIIDDDLYDYDTDVNEEEDTNDKGVNNKDINNDIKNTDKQNEEFVF